MQEPAHTPTAAQVAAHAAILADRLGRAPARWLLVDVASQTVTLVRDGAAAGRWPCSTARAGVDAREGSGGTPPGLHHIARRIGADAPRFAVFESREPTGEVWRPGTRNDGDLILTRILTLDGCEDGINRGTGVDSRTRFIYLHGTNHESDLGRPMSGGCIRLRSADIEALFVRVEEGDPVVIA